MNGQKKLTAAVQPGNATNQAVTWTSNKLDVATVDAKTGLVTGKSAGQALITVTTEDGGKTASCVVTVLPTSTAVTGVTVSPTTLSLAVGNTSKLTAVVAPANATNKLVNWTSNNPKVAAVGLLDGLVTAVSAGTCTITATTLDGKKTAVCSVTVTNVAVNKTSLSLGVGKTETLSVTGTPAASTRTTITWASNNTACATVNSSTGVVTAVLPGDATITATVVVTVNGKETTYKPTCKVTVTAPKAADIVYTVGSQTPVTFSQEDFNRVCTNLLGRPLNYVTFPSLPTSGILYYDYRSNGGYGHKVNTSNAYYYNGSSYQLSMVSFVPNSNFSGTVTIPYIGRDDKNTIFTGNVAITVGSVNKVTYSTGLNTPLTLDNDAFDRYVQNRGYSNFSFIQFTPPAGSRGTLYYQYNSSGGYDSVVSNTIKYYRSGSPRLSSVTFVPADGYTGTVSIPFTGVDNGGSTFTGTLEIVVSRNGTTVTYHTQNGAPVTFNDQDFNDFCIAKTGTDLDYVTFSLPNRQYGTLYYNYKSNSNTGSAVSSTTRYYRNSSAYLDQVTFLPASGYSGTVDLSFTGRSTGGATLSGTVKIYVGSGAGDVTYSTTGRTPAAFRSSDFNTYCKNVVGGNLEYVIFTLPDAKKGTLYLNYQNPSNPGTAVVGSTKYYRSQNPGLDNISFVAAQGFSGTVTILFSARNANRVTFNGTVSIEVKAVQDASIIVYQSDGSPVFFQTADFVRACEARGAGALSYVNFNLPNTAYGKLYQDYQDPVNYSALVRPAVAYHRNGTPNLSSVAFLPKAGFSGSVTIPYTGFDVNRAEFSGIIQIQVTPPTTSQRFGDMGNYGWGAPSVDFLSQAGIVNGNATGQFMPAASISRGDFMLMLYRAFHLSGSTADNFSDVPPNSYYAEAIAVAKALGIAQGSQGNFNPTGPITREDAMVLIQRTVEKTGRTLPAGNLTVLDTYQDSAATADYAKGAMAALVQAGAIKGDDAHRLNPKGSITRVEMAVILHRVLTL